MSVSINLGDWNSIFAVPSRVVDEGLKFSDGVKLKVLLFVLRNCGRVLSEDEISKATGVNVTDIPEALEYWVNLGVFAQCGIELSPPGEKNKSNAELFVGNDIKKLENEAKDNSELENKNNYNSQSEIKSENQGEKEEVIPKKRFTVTKPQRPDYIFTSQRLAVDEELKMLVSEVQISFGRVLSNSDISTLLMLKDTCGLPIDVILMLIQYSISINKANMRTVEKIGIEWADEGIYTVAEADNKIRRIAQTNKNFSIVSSAFGINNAGSPTKKQLEYGDKWITQWHFSPEMLREAYERCVDSKGTMKFSYIDGILKRWNANGIKTLEQLSSFDLEPKTGKTRKASYDIEELEKIDTLDNI